MTYIPIARLMCGQPSDTAGHHRPKKQSLATNGGHLQCRNCDGWIAWDSGLRLWWTLDYTMLIPEGL